MTAPFILEDLDLDLEEQLVFSPGALSLLFPRVPFVLPKSLVEESEERILALLDP